MAHIRMARVSKFVFLVERLAWWMKQYAKQAGPGGLRV